VEYVDDPKNLIDMRGFREPLSLSCIFKKLENPEVPYIVTVVDDKRNRDEVIALARERNLKVRVHREHSDYYIRIDKEEEVAGLPTELGTDFEQVFLVTSSGLGQDDGVLGRVLMEDVLRELANSSDVIPQSIIFVNSGVYLVCEGSKILSELMSLERRNVRFFACDKSLEYYGVRQKLCVGTPIKAFNLVNYLTGANKVITLG